MEEEKDDEISIDLGKIKNFFKRKKAEEKPEVHTEVSPTEKIQEKKDDEIVIDFGKIKNIFKKREDKEKLLESKIEKQDTVTKQEVPQTTEIKQEEKDDDEIAIDLSKIKNIFRKKESREEVKADKGKDDDEISIDFSKIKNIKNIFKRSSKETTSDEDIAIDFKKIRNFISEHRVVLLLLILLIIPISLSVFLRIQPAILPITDQWATDSVINNLRSQIRGQINQQYPNLPDQNRNALVENELQRMLREQRSQIDDQVRATSNFFKSRLQDDTGQTYLLAIDPFFWMRHARNILENGHPGDELKDGKPWDNHMFAPVGRGIPFDMFNSYFEAFLFRVLSIFNKDLNLMTVVFYVPVLVSALAVIPAFFITRRIAGNFGGFVAATIVALTLVQMAQKLL